MAKKKKKKGTKTKTYTGGGPGPKGKRMLKKTSHAKVADFRRDSTGKIWLKKTVTSLPKRTKSVKMLKKKRK